MFFTTPAERHRGKGKPHKPGSAPAKRIPVPTPSNAEKGLTIVLMLAWLCLMLFGILAYVNPPWLEELSRAGIRVEAQDFKNWGDHSLRGDRYLEAIPLYERALQIKPSDGGIMANLGIARIRAGDKVTGRRILQETMKPEGRPHLRAVACFSLGQLCEVEGKPAEAIQYYEEALRCGAQEDKVHRRLSALFLTTGDIVRAKAALEATLASQLDPALSYRCMLEEAKENHLEEPDQLAELEGPLARGIRAEDLQRYDLEIILQAQRSDKDIARTRNDLGGILARMGDLRGGVEQFEESLRIWPDNMDALRNLALAKRMLAEQAASQPAQVGPIPPSGSNGQR